MTSASASRVTRSRRNLQLAVLLFASCLAMVTVLRAQEPAPPARGQQTTEGTEGTESTESAGAKKSAAAPAPPNQDEQDKAEAPANPDRKPGVVGATPGRFEPTEKVRADFDVSFPVDI